MDPRIELDPNGMAMFLASLSFAAGKHRDQRRKDPQASPYINHPIDVASILYFEGGIRDCSILAAAILHDTMEDTDTNYDELVEHFGQTVADIVADVTDDTSLPKKERKRQQVAHAPFIRIEAKLVKLADKISNLRDVHNTPPNTWSNKRQAEYFNWAKDVIHGLRGTNARLELAFDTICERYFARENGDGSGQ